jgi:hypothetical protein
LRKFFEVQNWQVDLPEGLGALAGRDVVERRRPGSQLV